MQRRSEAFSSLKIALSSSPRVLSRAEAWLRDGEVLKGFYFGIALGFMFIWGP